MKKFKQSVVMFVAAALFAFSVAGPAFAENRKKKPTGDGTDRHSSLDFYGTKKCIMTPNDGATSGVLCASGEGLLDAICTSGGTLGHYAMAMDTGIAANVTVHSSSLRLSPAVYTHTDTTSVPNGGPCWSARNHAGGPVRFVNGLVGVHSGASPSTILYYHLSDGSNP